MKEHIWKNDLYSLIIFPECLAIVSIGKQNLPEWFTPSVMKKRDAAEEARLSVIRKRTSRQREEDSPISLNELVSRDKSNRLVPAKDILESGWANQNLQNF